MKPSKRKKLQTTIYLSREQYAELELLRDRDHINASAFIRNAIDEALAKRPKPQTELFDLAKKEGQSDNE